MRKKKTFLLVYTMFLLVWSSGCQSQNSAAEQTLEQTPEAQSTPTAPTATAEVKLESNDWSSIWVENANQSELPRILFVGDSITEGYYNRVKDILDGQFYPARYTTSKFLGNPDFQTELTTLLKRYDFQVIVLNNGLHGSEYSVAEYREGLEALVQILETHVPEADLIWCQTTPVREEGLLDELDVLNQEVTRRNRAAVEIMEKNGIAVLDLYAAMLFHPEYYKNDGFHFNEDGRSTQAKLITDFIFSQR